MEKTATIYHRNGSEKTVDVLEAARLVGTGAAGPGKEWSFHKPPPANWEREVPKYRASRDLLPAQKARFRSEPPFAETWQSDIWQYGERAVATGETIETTEWPHASFRPLNFSAEKVLSFFNSAIKSRMTRSPWFNGQVLLDNGLSGPTEIDIARQAGLTPAPRPAA